MAASRSLPRCPAIDPLTDLPPVRIDKPVMSMDWRVLTAVHWPVEPADVARMLPDGLEPDTFDGAAWVGLIPFDMRDIRPPGFPRGIPWIGSFPETNIRTYVVGPDGGRGVWFHSLDITRAGAVAVARLGYQLPYEWSRMSIERANRRFTYQARRWGRSRLRSGVVVDVGPRLAHHERTKLDRFLTNRWSLYADGPMGLVRARVDHGAWPLHRADLVDVEDDFASAAGYDVTGPPASVRFSPGVDVAVGLPERLDV